MACYELKTKPGTKIDFLPDKLYQEIFSLYFLLTGKDRDKASKTFIDASEDVRIDMKNLGLKYSKLVATNIMIGHQPIGQDIIWAAIARAELYWNYNYGEESYKGKTSIKDKIKELTEIISELEPTAKRAYDDTSVVYARGGYIDLGTETSLQQL